MKKLLTICIFLLLLATSVNAFGVASFYYKEKPLILNPGSSTDVKLILQLEPNKDPISVKAEIVGGQNIAQLTGKSIYYVSGNTPVDIKITIPETVKIGDEYSVGVQFTTVAKPGNEMMEFGTQVTSGIPIVIGKVIEPQKSLTELLNLEKLGPVAIILVLIVIVLLLMRSFKKKKK